MRKFSLLFVATAIVLTLGISPAFGAANGTDRPYKGAGSGTQTITSTGLPVTAIVDGTLHGTHVGLATFHTTVINPTGGPTSFTGTNTVTAANGDMITGPITGVFTGPNTVEFTSTVSSGTGRFAGATGSATVTATITPTSDPAVSTLTFTFTGTLSY